MTIQQQISVTSTTDEDGVIATITTAFTNDPVLRWIFRAANHYLTYWPKFVKVFAGGAFAQGTVDSVDECAGVAMWLPPGIASDEEAMGAVTADAVPAAEQAAVFAFFDQMGEFHPHEPHWYLPLIGVDLTKQGRGYGSALVRHGVARCDRDRLPAYLEATSPLNKALYERHGFEAFGVIQADGGPPMWPMLRRPE
jgi:ribosomal protein S18 acetylase RimI-like enzyme